MAEQNPTTDGTAGLVSVVIADDLTNSLRKRGEIGAADEIQRLRHRLFDMKAERARLLGALRDLKAEVIRRCEGALLP